MSKSGKIRNPLRRRILRELTGDWKKYIVVVLFLIFMVGFISGMYVANGSMLAEFEESASKYKREDGHFILYEKADRDFIDAVEKEESVTIYKDHFKTQHESWSDDIEGTEKLSEKQKKELKIRIYPVRKKINLACVMSGRLPEKEGEIAIDRMHADNVGLKPGDTLKAGEKKLKITGLVSNSDYTTLYENSSDIMFDALTFDVGIVTKETFDELSAPVHYAYSYYCSTKPGNAEADPAKDDVEEKKRADDMVETLFEEALKRGNRIEDYVPAYANQAIQFAPEDFSTDMAMGGVILYVLIVVLAFVFAITISNTITRESTVIGTLRASGYTRTELVRHYMAAPIIVTLIGGAIGNVLGYTLFKDIVVSMYYNSYGLPEYQTRMSGEALIKTTLIPIAIMFAVNLIVIVRKLRCTPLQFLRRDLKKQRKRKTVRLPGKRFLPRFRLRVLLQNLPGYAVLFAGIVFVMIMLAMAVGLPDSLHYYQNKAPEMMLAPHQTVLRSYRDETGAVLKTKAKGAEKFAMASLIRQEGGRREDIEAFGISKNSRYVTESELDGLSEKEVLVSKAYAAKFNAAEGDTIRLSAKYEKKSYRFKVAGINSYESGCAVFMPISRFCKLFDLENDEFSGWFSEKTVSDIDQKYILNEITAKDIRKMTDQLDHSFGGYMIYFQYLCIALAAVLMFLLTKLIVERNENAISMTKILGYTNGEIARVYLTATTIAVIISEVIAVYIGCAAMSELWKVMMSRMNGWFDFFISRSGIAKMLVYVFIAYLIVMAVDFRRIRKIPMDEALKNVE